MFRFFIMPMVIGVVVFLVTWLVSPLVIADPGIVPLVARSIVDFSNSRFETMPPVIASYVAHLNLALVAFTAALLVMLVIQLALITWKFVVLARKWLGWCLLRFRRPEAPRDLPPLEMDSSFKPSKIGQGVIGRGLDSIDRD